MAQHAYSPAAYAIETNYSVTPFAYMPTTTAVQVGAAEGLNAAHAAIAEAAGQSQEGPLPGHVLAIAVPGSKNDSTPPSGEPSPSSENLSGDNDDDDGSSYPIGNQAKVGSRRSANCRREQRY